MADRRAQRTRHDQLVLLDAPLGPSTSQELLAVPTAEAARPDDAILEGLLELEANQVRTLDCRKAQFAADEPIARVRMLCQSWRVMFQAEYSSGQPLCLLVDLRTAVETALENLGAGGEKALGAAAAAGAASANPPQTRKSPSNPAMKSARIANPKPARPK